MKLKNYKFMFANSVKLCLKSSLKVFFIRKIKHLKVVKKT